MKRVWRSFSTSFGVVPDAMSAWKPDSAPHAMVTKRNGNNAPDTTGPVSPLANSLIAGTVISGRTTITATARTTMTPTFMNVER